jgi:radical SAM protein with 4Fe4S-binding SPASM domain
LRPSPGDTIALLARDRAQYLREMRRFCGSFIGPPGDRLFRCGAGHNPCVDAYGRVQLCLLLRAPECTADLRDTPLREALHEVFPALQSLRATNPDYLARCARCFLKGLCNQCPAKSWSEHGTLDTPVEYLCELAHAQAVDMGLLADGEYGWEVADWRECVARFVAEEVLLPV